MSPFEIDVAIARYVAIESREKKERAIDTFMDEILTKRANRG